MPSKIILLCIPFGGGEVGRLGLAKKRRPKRFKASAWVPRRSGTLRAHTRKCVVVMVVSGWRGAGQAAGRVEVGGWTLATAFLASLVMNGLAGSD